METKRNLDTRGVLQTYQNQKSNKIDLGHTRWGPSGGEGLEGEEEAVAVEHAGSDGLISVPPKNCISLSPFPNQTQEDWPPMTLRHSKCFFFYFIFIA